MQKVSVEVFLTKDYNLANSRKSCNRINVFFIKVITILLCKVFNCTYNTWPSNPPSVLMPPVKSSRSEQGPSLLASEKAKTPIAATDGRTTVTSLLGPAVYEDGLVGNRCSNFIIVWIMVFCLLMITENFGAICS